MRRSAEARRIAILAGGGSLPREIAECLLARGAHVHVIAIDGAADCFPLPCPLTVVHLAQVGKILSVLKAEALTEMLIIGSVTRPDLGAIRPDIGFFLALPTAIRLIWAGGDDAVLRGVVGFFERHGIKIAGPADVAPELILPRGPYGRLSATADEMADVERGLAIIKSLAPFDVGQAVVVAHGRVEAIEGVEGTDAMLRRVAASRIERQGGTTRGGVLVKGPKPGQELRVDLPTIGPNTISGIIEAGLSGIAVAADYVLAAERFAMRTLADSHGVFVEGVPADMTLPSPSHLSLSLRQIGRRPLSPQQRADSLKGGQVISTLQGHGVAAGVTVVHRSHVLVVETGEGIDRALARARDLHQWGRRLRWRRSGVAVLARGRDLNDALVAKAADAGLAGIAVMPEDDTPAASQEAIEAAKQRGLFIAMLIRGTENEDDGGPNRRG